MTARLLIGDVFERMAELEDGSVDLVLTSPPFLALRSYLPADHPDKAKEIGSEPTPAAFLDTLLRLTAEWRRLLAPHGSICVELGDTYAGSGGAGGDYGTDGLRDGQPKFRQQRVTPDLRRDGLAGEYGRNEGTVRLSGGTGWPLSKSLCGIPHLYHLSLAYGRNLLTGEPSPAGQWRVRNVVAWCRPNPPVGALGDKFRPATSYLTIACVSGQRYFDLDAGVRTAQTEPDRVFRKEKDAERDDGWGRAAKGIQQNPAGAPPLDWWEIPTHPYPGAHYATWPPALCTRPILAMCPAFVCLECGTALGSGHAGTSTTQVADNLLPGMRWSDHEPMDHLDHSVLLEDLREPSHGPQQVIHQGLDTGLQGVHPAATTRPPDGESRRLRDGAPLGDGSQAWARGTAQGDGCPSRERSEGRQPAGEPDPTGEGGTRSGAEGQTSAGRVSVLRARRSIDGRWACPCGSTALRPGVCLDPFVGSGTTLAVATGHGRDAIGIDLDARSAVLCAERVGMFLETDLPAVTA